MRRLVSVLPVGVVFLCSTGAASGEVVHWFPGDGGNGNTYELVTDSGGWDTARAAAEARGGHLVTITSQAEQDFVWNNVVTPQSRYAWIGGRQQPDGPEPDQGWQWLTEETWDYANWAAGQPDNAGDEDCAFLSLYPSDPGTWNDEDCGRSDVWYIVEYEGGIPAVSTWGLGVLVLLVMTAGTVILMNRRTRIAA